jgi:hypothetical protein
MMLFRRRRSRKHPHVLRLGPGEGRRQRQVYGWALTSGFLLMSAPGGVLTRRGTLLLAGRPLLTLSLEPGEPALADRL